MGPASGGHQQTHAAGPSPGPPNDWWPPPITPCFVRRTAMAPRSGHPPPGPGMEGDRGGKPPPPLQGVAGFGRLPRTPHWLGGRTSVITRAEPLKPSTPRVSDYIGHPWRSTPAGPHRPLEQSQAPRPPEPPPPSDQPPGDRHPWWIVIIGLILLGGLAATLFALRQLEERRAIVEAERVRFAGYLVQRDAIFKELSALTAAEQALLRRSRNADHVARGRSLGVTPIARRDEVEDRVGEMNLVRLEGTPGYWVSRLTHSHPYLTPDGVAVLDTISVRFQARLAGHGLPAFRYNVTSVLRTQQDQARLRGVNVNAAAGTSSHEYGTTFDVHYRRFAYAGDSRSEIELALGPLPYPFLYDEFARELREFYELMARRYPTVIGAELGRTLIEMETAGYVLAIRERLQPVYHMTVNRRLATPPS
jgi:hypothetical protein